MKKITTILSFFLLTSVTCTFAQERKKITDYFEHQIITPNNDNAPSQSFSIKQLATKRALVWNAWKAANQNITHLEALPPINPLGNYSFIWQIPDSLEPQATLPFYYGSKGTMPTEGYPMFLYLHGSGPKQQEWTTGLALAQQFNDGPSVYFIPQIPNEGEWYRWWQRGKQFIWQQLLRNLLLSDQINANRLYVFGISEGGYGSQRLASYYADYWAAAGPMAGGEPLKNAPVENLENIGFSLRTGANDAGFYRNTLTRYTLEALDSIENLYPSGFRHKVKLIPNRQHFIDYSETTPWLSKFKRNAHPNHFIWEDFEMDGQHRTGFYNLRVLQRPDSERRTRYDVTIKDNTVNIVIENINYTTTQRDPHFGIEMKFCRQYTPAQGGRIRIYLDEHLVNLLQPVTIQINGKQILRAKPQLNIEHLATSLATFYDPERIYPTAFEVSY